MNRARSIAAALLAALALSAPAAAQIRTVDPSAPEVSASAAQADTAPREAPPAPAPAPQPVPSEAPPITVTGPEGAARTNLPTDATYRDEEIFGAAEKVFGKGAQGLAKLVENVLSNQGRPTAYIGGREAGGAIAVGVRYGQGDLFHKVEGGAKPVFWTGPSIGLDIGGAGSKVLILVYNLYDSEEIFQRFPLVEGNLYAIGGFTASYLRRGDVVLVPIRLGVGWRFGASVGYLRFTKEGRVLPF